MTDVLFDEQKILEPILWNGFSHNRANKYELVLLAKHYKWNMGYGTQKISSSIIDFCKEHDPNFNAIIARDFLKECIRIGENNKFRRPIPVQITDREINKIRNIKNFDAQKMLFSMLAISKTLKFMNTDVSGKSSQKKQVGYYISLGMLGKVKKISDLTRMSNKDTLFMLHDLYNLGYIEPTYHNSIRIVYSDDTGVPEIFVEDFSKIIEYYINYIGGELLYCSNCGEEFFKEGNKKDLCESCYNERRREQTRKRVQKYRKKQN